MNPLPENFADILSSIMHRTTNLMSDLPIWTMLIPKTTWKK